MCGSGLENTVEAISGNGLDLGGGNQNSHYNGKGS